MNHFQFFGATRIVFGGGEIAQIGDLSGGLGRVAFEQARNLAPGHMRRLRKCCERHAAGVVRDRLRNAVGTLRCGLDGGKKVRERRRCDFGAHASPRSMGSDPLPPA